jgi:hypothetical protein
MIGMTFAKFSHDALLSGGDFVPALREHAPSSLAFEHFSSDLSAYSFDSCAHARGVRQDYQLKLVDTIRATRYLS